MPIINLSEQESREVIPGWHAKFVHSDNMTMVYWDIKVGSELPDHIHAHEQIMNITEGKFRLVTEKDVQILEPGIAAVIPANTKHGGTALTNCKFIDAFYPVRKDYVRGENNF